MPKIICRFLFVLLLAGCARYPDSRTISLLPQPALTAEEQPTAPFPLQQPQAAREIAAVESAAAEATRAMQPRVTPSVFSALPESRTSISPDAIRVPSLSLRDSPLPQFAPRSAPSSNAEQSLRVYLPLLISIDQRVLDARARFDCSQAEVLDAPQCDALLIFYALTNGPAWKMSDGWLEDRNPCQWYGLECPQPEYDRVKLLLLPDNNLDGRLPYEIYQLPLTFLRVPGNHLSGSIPPTIGDMTDLEEIRLESNQLSGQVPTGIANLSSTLGRK